MHKFKDEACLPSFGGVETKISFRSPAQRGARVDDATLCANQNWVERGGGRKKPRFYILLKQPNASFVQDLGMCVARQAQG